MPRPTLFAQLTQEGFSGFTDVFCYTQVDGHTRIFNHLIPPGAHAAHWIEDVLPTYFHGLYILITSALSQRLGRVNPATSKFNYV